MKFTRLFSKASAALTCGALVLAIAACSSGGGGAASSGSPSVNAGPTASLVNSPALRYPANAAAPTPDPRVGLRPGYMDAGTAIWNLRLLSHVGPSEGFSGRGGTTGSDIAFTGNLAILGNYRGFQIFDISNPSQPRLVSGFICPASQGDPSVVGNLLFISGEGGAARNDCGIQGVADSVSMDRFRGVRIMDISNPAQPKIVANVQTCRGSHTHTVVSDPSDRNNAYIYVSGYSNTRSPQELPGCQNGPPGDNNSAQYRIEVIQVPLSNPAQAKVVNSPHLLADLSGRTVHAPPPGDVQAGRGGGGGGGGGGRGGAAAGAAGGAAPGGAAPAAAGGGGGGGGGRAGAAPAAGGAQAGRGGGGGGGGGPQIGQSGCHDITAYAAVGLAGGACSGYGLLFDIRDVKDPKRLYVVADSNMSFWHSATFSNDGDKLLFSDEWGGGGQPRCRATDPLIWGGNAIFTLQNNQLQFKSYIKMPGAQADNETCTAHNGSLIPIPGREVMVQSYYQGGITMFDWTDAAHPFEIGFYDEGPSAGSGGSGGFWSSYWYNGVIVGSDEGRGMYVWELTPGPYLSQNEIDAAKTVRMQQFNAQDQQKFVWPPSFALARAYVDQLERNSGLPNARIAAVRTELTNAERATGAARNTALTALATSLNGDLATAGDRGRVQRLIGAVQGLAR